MTETTTIVEEKSESLSKFNERLIAEMNKINLLSSWSISLWNATDGEVELPWSPSYDSESITVHKPQPKKLVEKSWEPGEFYETTDYSAPREVDIEATNKLIAKIIKHARKCGYQVEKKYDGSTFRVTVVLLQVGEKRSYNDVTYTYNANRQSVCEKVVTIVHHEAETKVIEAHDEEVVEWNCEKISFMAMNDTDSVDEDSESE